MLQAKKRQRSYIKIYFKNIEAGKENFEDQAMLMQLQMFGQELEGLETRELGSRQTCRLEQ